MTTKGRIGFFAAALAAAFTVGAAELPPAPAKLWDETPAQKAERMAWWTHDRFGMFIHFGLYALPARHEWVKQRERMDDAWYDTYFKHFDPDLFDAKEWARAAKSAGMKYMVLTSKHHEGFCLFDSKFTDFKITNTPFKRDLVKEYVEAARAEGLKVGFYYSLIDWHHPDFTIDFVHPQRGYGKGSDWGGGVDTNSYAKLNVGKDMNRYRQYLKDQVTELLTNYGKIDILWFDFSYPGEFGKGWRDWDSVNLVKLARRLQPGVIIDNRCDLNDTWGGWDFLTPEQFKVTEWPTKHGERVPWETCQTFSGSWGYHRDEATWKSPAQLIGLLVHSVAHGGNLILNVGPTGRGAFDDRAKERLEAIGEWMRFNGRAIYGCTAAPDGFETPEGCALTYNPKTNRLYVHLYDYPMGMLYATFPKEKVEYAQFLHDASEVWYNPPDTSVHSHNGDRPKKAYGHFRLPVVKPRVEVPVIEVYLK